MLALRPGVPLHPLGRPATGAVGSLPWPGSLDPRVILEKDLPTKQFVSMKDLAQIMELHPRSVRRWWRKLKVPPTVEAHHCNRWSPADAKKLLDRWAIAGLRKKMQSSPLTVPVHPAVVNGNNGHRAYV